MPVMLLGSRLLAIAPVYVKSTEHLRQTAASLWGDHFHVCEEHREKCRYIDRHICRCETVQKDISSKKISKEVFFKIVFRTGKG